jgi:short-subunit dehydrogenase
MQLFLSQWRTTDLKGILNVLSSSGRCGYPLMSTYAAAHAALWTLSESVMRESGHEVPCMISIFPSQNSPLQTSLVEAHFVITRLAKLLIMLVLLM